MASASTSSCRPRRSKPIPVTGRLTARLEGLPQFPFNEFNLHLFGSERGLLATPTAAGPTRSTARSHRGIRRSARTDIDPVLRSRRRTQRDALPRTDARLQSDLQRRSRRSRSGGPLPVHLSTATRPDGDQDALGINVNTPPGFTASLKGVPYCPEAAIAQLQSPGLLRTRRQSWPLRLSSASQVGDVDAGAGAGTHQVYVQGRVFLAGSLQRRPPQPRHGGSRGVGPV